MRGKIFKILFFHNLIFNLQFLFNIRLCEATETMGFTDRLGILSKLSDDIIFCSYLDVDPEHFYDLIFVFVVQENACLILIWPCLCHPPNSSTLR